MSRPREPQILAYSAEHAAWGAHAPSRVAAGAPADRIFQFYMTSIEPTEATGLP